MKAALCGVTTMLAAILIPGATAATEIKVIASNAVREAYLELVPMFEKATGHKVTIIWGGTVDIIKRIGGGEVVDIAIIPAPAIDDLIKQGKLAAGSRVDVARSGVGVAVRAGARKPDISSGESWRPSAWLRDIGRLDQRTAVRGPMSSPGGTGRASAEGAFGFWPN